MERIKINSLADFKRAVQPGVSVSCLYHLAFGGRDEKGCVIFKDEDRGVRPVAQVKATQFSILSKKKNGEEYESWLHWPKASEIKIENDKVIIYDFDKDEEGKEIKLPMLTYQIFK